jgi:hypothetical protein
MVLDKDLGGRFTITEQAEVLKPTKAATTVHTSLHFILYIEPDILFP